MLEKYAKQSRRDIFLSADPFILTKLENRENKTRKKGWPAHLSGLHNLRTS
jgi:hypothetical protein